MHQCPSGVRCFGQGGEAITLAPRDSARVPGLTARSISSTSRTDSEGDFSAVVEGPINKNQFPTSVPLPPVSRLPAEFECNLCFKVQKFWKPSDWTKHVFEDVQPYTCTFPSCTDPKTFKRKADWVRHEHERHRHLEWWECNLSGCAHKCYRRDNFVQHLVREHKMPEPNMKGQSIKEKSDVVPGNDHVLRLITECRQDTKARPEDEICKFCGQVCTSWKKLTDHLANHMEQTVMPL